MEQAWANVAVYDELPPAKTLEGFLRTRGIDVRTYNDRLLQILWFWSAPHLPFRVQVRKHQYQQATELLTKAPPPELQKAAHCPACGSLRVNYPQMTRKSILPALMWHIGVICRVLVSEACCEVCQHNWVLSESGSVPKTPMPKPFPFK